MNVVGSNPIGRSIYPHPVGTPGGVRFVLDGSTTTMATRRATKLPKVHVKDSGIHGKGLFASEDIPADVHILTIEGRPTTRDGTYVIWTFEDRDEPEGFLITNDAKYVNHSTKPNAAFYEFELWSLRRIRKGEEILHHYGPDWNDVG